MSKLITRAAVNQVLRDYWDQYKNNKVDSILGFLLPAIGTVFVFFVPPLVVAKLLDIFVAQGFISLYGIGKYLVMFGGLWLLGEVLWRIGEYFITRVKAKGMNALTMLAFKRLADRDYHFYTNNFVGSLTKKGQHFSRNFDEFTNILNFSIITNLFPIVFAVVILARYSFWLPIALVGALLLGVVVAIPVIRKRAVLVAERHDASSKMVGYFSDAATNMLAIKSFAKEKVEYKHFGVHVDDFTRKFKRAGDYGNLRLNTMLSPIYVLTNVMGLTLAIFLGERTGLETGAIFIVFTYFSQVTRIFWEIHHVYRTIESTISEAAEFNQLFIDPPLVKDVRNAKALKITKAEIDFKEVEFKYAEQRKDGTFLKGFNLRIQSNQKVGLVGPSGGGKTTITKLILRFIDVNKGIIAIDGQDIKKVTQESLREAIAYVPQEPLLFHRSLRENIAYGNEHATDAEVVEAAKIAHVDEFIRELPEGYDTMVGERGIKLSGGQRQRVAIARALLKKSPILVLDEATSALDSESEKYIQEGLWELMKDKTAIVIAHRLSTIKHLDRIVVLDEGKIVQDGTHEELIQQEGLYGKLWSIQSGDFLVE